MQGAVAEARARGAQTMDIGADEPDAAAIHLHGSLGLSNRVGAGGYSGSGPRLSRRVRSSAFRITGVDGARRAVTA